MRIKLIVEYDGTAYAGWQRQKNAVSVQQKIEEAVLKVTGKGAVVNGAGRTDAGVHALGQVAHFDTDSKIPPEKFAYALNANLPQDIRIRSSNKTDEDFDARGSAKIKHYRYLIYNAPQANALNRRICAHVSYPLDIEKMRAAASMLTGEHDFSSFCAAGSTPVKTKIRTIYEISVLKSGEYISIDVKGNGFLYNMVRIMAGTLIEAGKGKLTANDVGDILLKKDRSAAPATAPAKGLTMVEVSYKNV